MSTWPNVRLLALLLPVFAGGSLEPADSAQATPPGRDEAIQLLRTCPAWSDAKANRNQIVVCLRRLSQCDSAILRAVTKAFVAECRANGTYTIAAMSKLFVLNRFVFNVPEHAKFSGPFFGGWEGVPHDEREMNVMWPLSHGKDGQLELSGAYGGYSGERFRALEEFDFFLRKYGRRSIPRVRGE
jgi:hypothetical protein